MQKAGKFNFTIFGKIRDIPKGHLMRKIKQLLKPTVRRMVKSLGYHMDFGFFTRHFPTFVNEPQFSEAYKRACQTTANADPGFP